MSKYYKAFNTLKGPVTHLKNIVSSAIGKKQKTTGTEVINKVKPNVPKTKLEKTKSKLAIAKQKTKASQAKLDNTIFRINQQKKRLETGPGSANPKRPGKMGGGFMGKRMGYKKGTGLTRKSNVEKIKKTFGTKKGLGMQSVIYGLDKNPKITAADPKAKFIAAANKKKKKKVI